MLSDKTKDWLKVITFMFVVVALGIVMGTKATWLSLGLLTFVTMGISLHTHHLETLREHISKIREWGEPALISITCIAWAVALVGRPIWRVFHGGISVTLHSFIR